MKRLTALIWVELLQLWRQPGYLFPTVALPAMLYAFFGLPLSDSPRMAGVMLASYALFALISVGFFQFGVGWAQDRAGAWDRYVRTLPGPAWERIAARLVTAVFVLILALLVLVAVALAFTPLALPWTDAGRLAGALALGALPLILAGVAFGALASAKSSVALANLIVLPLAYASGLWFRPDSLPEPVQAVSWVLPPRQAAELAWAAALGHAWELRWVASLALYSAMFGVLAAWAYRRDTRRRYR